MGKGESPLTNNLEFLEEAHRLFVGCGLSVANATKRLNETWSVGKDQVYRIVRTNGWVRERKEYLRWAASQGEAVKHAIADLEKMRRKYKTRFDGTKEWTSQDVMQFRALIDQILELRGVHPKLQRGEGALVIASDAELEEFVKAIREDEVLGPVLKKRIRQVRAEFERRLKEVKGETGNARGTL